MLLQTINAGEGVEEKGTLLHCWWECKSVQLLWEQYGRTTRGSSNPTPEHISRENHNLKRHMHPSVHSGTIHSSQDMEATYMSIDRGMDKEDVVHTDNGILAIKRNKIGSFVETRMDLETVIQSEIRSRCIKICPSYAKLKKSIGLPWWRSG